MSCALCASPMRLEVEGLFDDRYGHPGEFAVAKCVKCGFMSTEPRFGENDLAELYSSYYPRRRTTADDVRRSAASMAIGTAEGRRHARLVTGQWAAHYEVEPGMRVLDYGCGDCASLLEIRELGADPFGVEVDPNVRELARDLELPVHVGPLETLAEPDGSFDAVTLSQVIEHVTDPETLLRGLHAKLKSGGLISITSPNSRALSRRLTGRRWLNWHIPYHQNHFHARALESLLERVGFRVTKSSTFTPIPWWEYQVELLLKPGERGKSHGYFERGDSAIRSTGVGRALLKPGRAAAVVAARAADALGLGDSLLVVARKR